jgi:hypothetical protein
MKLSIPVILHGAPSGHGLASVQCHGAVGHGIKHLRQLRILFANQAPLVLVDDLPPAHHLPKVMGVNPEGEGMDNLVFFELACNLSED